LQKKAKLEMGAAAEAACTAILKCQPKMQLLAVPEATRQVVINAAIGLDAPGETPAAVHTVRVRALARLQSMLATTAANLAAM
jgi:hypothetical protein